MKKNSWVIIVIISFLVGVVITMGFNQMDNEENRITTFIRDDFIRNISYNQVNVSIGDGSCGYNANNPMFKDLVILQNELNDCFGRNTKYYYSNSPNDNYCIPNTVKMLSISCETSSMHPTIDCYDTIYVCGIDGKNAKVGDIVVFFASRNDYNYEWFMHRVVQINLNGSIYTKGDNSDKVDSFLVYRQNITAKVIRIDYH